jgi:hypothetical protein
MHEMQGAIVIDVLAHNVKSMLERRMQRLAVELEVSSLELDVFVATHARGKPRNLDSSGGL